MWPCKTRPQASPTPGFCDLGTALQHEELHQQAIYAYREAGTLASDRPGIWYNLGISYTALNQLKAATLAYQQTLKLQPDHANAKHNLGLIEQRSVGEFLVE